MATDRKHKVLYLAEVGSLLPLDAQRKDKKARSTPLPWLKFRTAADTTAAGQRYAMRIAAVKACDDGFAVLCVYYELLATYGGDRIAALRGYLVNHHLRQASAPEIAQAIGCWDRELVTYAVGVLLREGLLVERQKSIDEFLAAIKADRTSAPVVDPPDDPDDNCADDSLDLFQAEAADDAPHGRRQQPRVRAVATGTRRRKPRRRYGRPAMEVPGKFHGNSGWTPTLETSDVRPETGDGQTADPIPDTPTAAAAAPTPAPPTADGQTGGEQTGRLPDGTTSPPEPCGAQDVQPADPMPVDVPTPPGDALPSAVPTAVAEPLQPTEADPGQGPGRTAAGPDMTWHSEAYAKSVMAELYPTRQDLVEQGRRCAPPQGPDEFERRELACIVACFDKALFGIGQVEAMRLLEKAIKEAKATHRKRARKTRGRLWVYWINQHMRGTHSGGPP